MKGIEPVGKWVGITGIVVGVVNIAVVYWTVGKSSDKARQISDDLIFKLGQQQAQFDQREADTKARLAESDKRAHALEDQVGGQSARFQQKLTLAESTAKSAIDSANAAASRLTRELIALNEVDRPRVLAAIQLMHDHPDFTVRLDQLATVQAKIESSQRTFRSASVMLLIQRNPAKVRPSTEDDYIVYDPLQRLTRKAIEAGKPESDMSLLFDCSPLLKPGEEPVAAWASFSGDFAGSQCDCDVIRGRKELQLFSMGRALPGDANIGHPQFVQVYLLLSAPSTK